MTRLALDFRNTLNVMSSSTWCATAVTATTKPRAERNPAADVSENQKTSDAGKIYADKLEQEKVATLEDATRWLTCTAMRWMLAIA